MDEEPLEERLERILRGSDTEQVRFIRELLDKNTAYESRIRELEEQINPGNEFIDIWIGYDRLIFQDEALKVTLIDEQGREQLLSMVPKYRVIIDPTIEPEDYIYHQIDDIYYQTDEVEGYHLYQRFPIGNYTIKVEVGDVSETRKFKLSSKYDAKLDLRFWDSRFRSARDG